MTHNNRHWHITEHQRLHQAKLRIAALDRLTQLYIQYNRGQLTRQQLQTELTHLQTQQEESCPPHPSP